MTKKRIIGLFLFVFLMIAVYGAGYLFGQSLCDDDDFNYKEDTINDNPVVDIDDDYNEVANHSEDVIIANTKLYIEEYNVSDKTISLKEMSVPVEFIGMTRDEILNEIEGFEKYIKTDDENIENMMLLDFSEKQMVIRKSYSKNEKLEVIDEESTVEYKYYIVLVDDIITVYDKTTDKVFIETAIQIDKLDKESKTQLTKGILVRNISEMYRILESFTS